MCRNSHLRHLLFLISILMLLVAVPIVFAADFFLEETLFEGESRDFHEDGYPYKVTLIGVFDREGKAQFEVNAERTGPLKESESDRLADGSSIMVRSVIAQAGGADFVQYNFFPATKIKDTVASVEEVAQGENIQVETAQEPAPETKQIMAAEKVVDSPKEETVEDKSLWRRFTDWLKSLF